MMAGLFADLCHNFDMRNMTRLGWALAIVMLAVQSVAAGEAELVLVAGASGRTGSQIVARLRAKGYAVRPLTSSRERAIQRHSDDWRWLEVDVRNAEQVATVMHGVSFVICAIGASQRKGPNGPQFVDFGGVRNLTDAASAESVRHFVLISSAAAGPHRKRSRMLEIGNIRYWKTRGENHLKASGVPYTIVGPGGLIDEPSAGEGLRVLAHRDYPGGSIRIGDVAMLAVDALTNPDAVNKAFAAIHDESVVADAWRVMLAELPIDAPTDEAPPTQ
jgi:uncharacterized protein YbjT (DUF2867 family)